MKVKILKIINGVSTTLFLFAGIFIYYGIFVVASRGIFINLLVGACFIAFSGFSYFKMKSLICFLKNNAKTNEYNIITYEIISQLFILMVALISISGIISRVFIEKTSVFD